MNWKCIQNIKFDYLTIKYDHSQVKSILSHMNVNWLDVNEKSPNYESNRHLMNEKSAILELNCMIDILYDIRNKVLRLLFRSQWGLSWERRDHWSCDTGPCKPRRTYPDRSWWWARTWSGPCRTGTRSTRRAWSRWRALRSRHRLQPLMRSSQLDDAADMRAGDCDD